MTAVVACGSRTPRRLRLSEIGSVLGGRSPPGPRLTTSAAGPGECVCFVSPVGTEPSR